MIYSPGTFTSRAVQDLTTRAMFYRVICEVLGFEDDDPMLVSLENRGICSLLDLVVLSDDQIDGLSFEDGNGIMKMVPLGARNKLRVLRSWYLHLQLVQGTCHVNWLDASAINEDEWDDYRVGVYVPVPTPATATPRAKSVNSRVSRPSPGKASTPVLIVPNPDMSASITPVVVGVLVDEELDSGERGRNRGDRELDDVFFDAIDFEVPLDDVMENGCDFSSDCITSLLDDCAILSVDCCEDGTAGPVTKVPFLPGCDDRTRNHMDYSHPYKHSWAFGHSGIVSVDWCLVHPIGDSNIVFDPGGVLGDDVFDNSAVKRHITHDDYIMAHVPEGLVLLIDCCEQGGLPGFVFDPRVGWHNDLFVIPGLYAMFDLPDGGDREREYNDNTIIGPYHSSVIFRGKVVMMNNVSDLPSKIFRRWVATTIPRLLVAMKQMVLVEFWSVIVTM